MDVSNASLQTATATMNVATILFAKSGVDIITEVFLDESHPYSKSQMFI